MAVETKLFRTEYFENMLLIWITERTSGAPSSFSLLRDSERKEWDGVRTERFWYSTLGRDICFSRPKKILGADQRCHIISWNSKHEETTLVLVINKERESPCFVEKPNQNVKTLLFRFLKTRVECHACNGTGSCSFSVSFKDTYVLYI
jgi:hypothetical protein